MTPQDPTAHPQGWPRGPGSDAAAALRVRRCSVDAILDLRHAVLRAGRPRATAHFDGDDLPTTWHVGAFRGDRAVGCMSLFQCGHDALDGTAWQLRGMAVADDARREGIASAVLAHGLQGQDASTWWCNARVSAVPFYATHGWTLASDRFDIPGVGPHHRMRGPS